MQNERPPFAYGPIDRSPPDWAKIEQACDTILGDYHAMRAIDYRAVEGIRGLRAYAHAAVLRAEQRR
jgi:hypothetical protein